MTEIHVVLGIITLIVAVMLVLWNGMRLAGIAEGPSFRLVLVGLLDLQVLLGLITFVLKPVGGMWLLHPAFMVVAVAVGHVLLKEKRPRKLQFVGYLLVVLLMLAGIWLPR